jgi:hypothetical protein
VLFATEVMQPIEDAIGQAIRTHIDEQSASGDLDTALMARHGHVRELIHEAAGQVQAHAVVLAGQALAGRRGIAEPDRLSRRSSLDQWQPARPSSLDTSSP